MKAKTLRTVHDIAGELGVETTDVAGDLERRVIVEFREAAIAEISDSQILAGIEREAQRTRQTPHNIKLLSFVLPKPPTRFAQILNGPAFQRRTKSTYYGLRLAEAYIRSRARRSAVKWIERNIGRSPIINKSVELYRSPATYENILTQVAADLMANESLRGSKTRVIKTDERSYAPLIFVSMPLARATTPAEFNTYVAAAF